MDKTPAKLREELSDFTRAVLRNWLALVGGAVVAVAQMSFQNQWRPITTISLFSAGLLIACFLAWRDERKNSDLLTERFESDKEVLEEEVERARKEREAIKEKIAYLLTPHFDISYENTEDCMFPVQVEGGPAGDLVARLRVRSDRPSAITGCRAELAFLEKDGLQIMPGSHLSVLFAPGSQHDSTNKTVYHEYSQHLEVLWLSKDGTATIITDSFPNAFREIRQLSRESRYSFHIKVFGNESPSTLRTLDVAVKDGEWNLHLRPLL
jgi:hypothetical protein